MADGMYSGRLLAGIVDERGARFLDTLLASGEVWVLAQEQDAGCWATALVFHARGHLPPLPMRVVPLWSTLTGLAACMEPAWRRYTPRRVTLSVLRQQALPMLDALGVLVGLDWRGGLRGDEVAACSLATALRAARLVSKRSNL